LTLLPANHNEIILHHYAHCKDIRTSKTEQQIVLLLSLSYLRRRFMASIFSSLQFKPKITRYNNTCQFRINSNILTSYLKRCTYIMTGSNDTYYNSGINEIVNHSIYTYNIHQYHRTGWPISHDAIRSVLAASTDCLIRVNMCQARLNPWF
jgi:hypothetical protein